MRGHSSQRGVSLIEVMVAVVVFSIGVLGIALLQMKGAQFSKQSGARTIAILEARSLADAMRANPAGVWGVSSQAAITGQKGDLSGSYYLYDGKTTPDPSTCGSVDPCKAAKKDLLNWLAQLGNGANNAAANSSVKVNSNTGTLTIASSWSNTSPGSNGSSNDAYQFDFQP